MDNMKYKIPEEVGRRYEELISFNRGRDFNKEVSDAIVDFREQFAEYINTDNEEAFENRVNEFNKIYVDLMIGWMTAVKIPSVMIAGPAKYPIERKRKEEERVHKLQGELYSNDGKMARFVEKTEKMFNPFLIKQ